MQPSLTMPRRAAVTAGALAATGNEKYLKGFGPPLEGFDQVPFNNMNAVRNAIGPATAGIIVEPIQGEGGVRPADLQFYGAANKPVVEPGAFDVWIAPSAEAEGVHGTFELTA